MAAVDTLLHEVHANPMRMPFLFDLLSPGLQQLQPAGGTR